MIIDSKCYVLYCFDFDRDLTKALFNYLIEYFNKINVEFNYAGYYNERYEIKYGEIETIKSKLTKQRWNEIVHFSFDDESVKGSKRRVGIEFNISRPILITLVLPVEKSFSLKELSFGIYKYFRIIYGFSYLIGINEWAAAYANGDWQHIDKIPGVIRVSKSILQKWNKSCELIRDGYIRDVYNENIVSTKHLGYKVNGETLEAYILKNKAGELELINSDIYLWKINDDRLEDVRDYLYKGTIVI